ncbi:hypothetical protein SAMN02927903_02769 [Flavobacterium caeni]|uniref:Uncharacterized protein n=1 Tax=Flavobacterium caeni TaxID=490189 RepID=A0A1G5JKQ3_9FLAO|nr:hypothetical protein SAMN02927903_02769 [Flavobacterium caeni]
MRFTSDKYETQPSVDVLQSSRKQTIVIFSISYIRIKKLLMILFIRLQIVKN